SQKTPPTNTPTLSLPDALPIPPPPPDVPELKESKEAALTGTLRQRMEQHRQNPMCAACHARMDPLGFGLENFNGIGEWREKEGRSEEHTCELQSPYEGVCVLLV